MGNNTNLAKILAQYGEQELWVALSENKEQVAGKGKTLKEALAEAKQNNIGNPVVIKAMPDYSKFILQNNVGIRLYSAQRGRV